MQRLEKVLGKRDQWNTWVFIGSEGQASLEFFPRIIRKSNPDATEEVILHKIRLAETRARVSNERNNGRLVRWLSENDVLPFGWEERHTNQCACGHKPISENCFLLREGEYCVLGNCCVRKWCPNVAVCKKCYDTFDKVGTLSYCLPCNEKRKTPYCFTCCISHQRKGCEQRLRKDEQAVARKVKKLYERAELLGMASTIAERWASNFML